MWHKHWCNTAAPLVQSYRLLLRKQPSPAAHPGQENHPPPFLRRSLTSLMKVNLPKIWRTLIKLQAKKKHFSLLARNNQIEWNCPKQLLRFESMSSSVAGYFHNRQIKFSLACWALMSAVFKQRGGMQLGQRTSLCHPTKFMAGRGSTWWFSKAAILEAIFKHDDYC